MTTKQTAGAIHPVILCGGGGERLWPLSRTSLAKQLIRLQGKESLLERTVDRVAAVAGESVAPLVLCAEADRFIVAEQVHGRIGKPGRIILEPMRRDTAAAVALAVTVIVREDPSALLLVCPADHIIMNTAGFKASVEAGLAAAREGQIVTIGIEPDEPHTGYGYIEAGAPIGTGPVREVARFVEKPDRERAVAMLAEGRWFWNAGIFLFRADVMAEAMKTHYGDGYAAVARATETMTPDLDFLRIDGASFAAAPKISIDFAVIEKTGNVAVVPATFDWNDVGSWVSLGSTFAADAEGNAIAGTAALVDSKNSIVYADDGILAAVLGVEDLIVAATRDAVMVAPKARAQEIKRIVAKLREEGRRQADEHLAIFRPWGHFQGLAEGARYQVKRICVKPGQRLSLQHHHHRAEHWIVVRGTAKVEIDGEVKLLTENESVYIPIGAVHRLENPGKIVLELIEVQTGSYLGEDDVIRLDDSYNR